MKVSDNTSLGWWMDVTQTHLCSGCGVVDPGVQAAVEQLFLGVALLQEPLGLDDLLCGRQPSLQTHPFPQTCRAQTQGRRTHEL